MRRSCAFLGMLCLLAALSTGCCGQHCFTSCYHGCGYSGGHGFSASHFGDWDHGDGCGCDECSAASECSSCASTSDCGSCGSGCGSLIPFRHWGCRPAKHTNSGCGGFFGWGCGDMYVFDYISDPPACCEPCDGCGHWIGPTSSKPCGGDGDCCDYAMPGQGCQGCASHGTHSQPTYVPNEPYYSASRKQPVRSTAASARPIQRTSHATTASRPASGRGRATAPNSARTYRTTNERATGSRVASLGAKS
ncbi:MAG: hypothetical protein KDA42_10555 [Planctomycetales bacterium]|nr:hypothetical protein [Planctomycetales bacterium]